MPVGPYPDFPTCHGAMVRKGYSPDEADRICGSMEQGSSQKPKTEKAVMPFGQEAQQEEKSEGEEQTAKVEFSQQQAEVVAAAVMNAYDAIQNGEATPEVLQQLEAAKTVISEVMNVAEEEPAPAE